MFCLKHLISGKLTIPFETNALCNNYLMASANNSPFDRFRKVYKFQHKFENTISYKNLHSISEINLIFDSNSI
jgi:hypothetical protein